MTLVLPVDEIEIVVCDLRTALASYNSHHWFHSFRSNV
jgi:hypothetical protein